MRDSVTGLLSAFEERRKRPVEEGALDYENRQFLVKPENAEYGFSEMTTQLGRRFP
jgi:hypothetical protein